MNLSEFIASLADKPVIWGETDCSATPHRWLMANGISAELPVYKSRDEAHAIIASRGSLVNVWDWCLRSTEIQERYGDPVLGDIAIVDTRIYGQIGGIVAKGGILAIRRDDGAFHWFGPVRKFVKVWAVT